MKTTAPFVHSAAGHSLTVVSRIGLALLAMLMQIPANAVEEKPAPPPSVFELPFLQARYVAMQQAIAQLSAQGKYEQAEQLSRQAGELVPHDPLAKYNLACALARQSKTADALAALTRAIELGFNQTEYLQKDEDLTSLHELPEFVKLVEQSRTAKPDPKQGWQYSPAPAAIVDGVATVSEQNTAWDGQLGTLRAFFQFPEKTEAPAVNGLGEAGKLVQEWYAAGTAAGNLGDLYDNHDSDHSNMSYQAFPQLARIEFAEEAKKRQLHHGLQGAFFYNAPTIGNSSTAITGGPFWRSQGRAALTQNNGAARLALQYYSNHIYFYPEHRDYDPGRNGTGDGYGDVFPANTPYMVLSQGSSGSDRVFMDAFMLTWAAFRPEVKAKLKQMGVLAPTTQMIFRRSNKQVAAAEDYFTGKAHPPVFDGAQLDPLRMVNLAQELTADTLPPVARIEVLEENLGTVGIDYFDVSPREKLFDTPAAIARLVKSVNGTRRMVVSAEGSKELNDQPLTYRWVLLRGDPQLVQINPLGTNGSRAEIVVQRHQRRPISEGSPLESSRVDIGLIVSNDKYPSAPAFISLQFLENQKLTFDANGRLLSVDYADAEASKNYVDPLLDTKKTWRDEYLYDAADQMIGWERVRADDDRERFTFDGCLVTEKDDAGRPLVARVMSYVPQQVPGPLPILEQMATKQEVRYVYESAADMHGKRAE